VSDQLNATSLGGLWLQLLAGSAGRLRLQLLAQRAERGCSAARAKAERVRSERASIDGCAVALHTSSARISFPRDRVEL
jgi:hypothetical protein